MSEPLPGATAAVLDPTGLSAVDVVLRPERFFPEGARRLSTPVLVGLVLLLGASSMIDRIDMSAVRIVMQTPGGQALQSWRTYWVAVIVGSLAAGPIAYFLAGWWYRVRLVWSGATEAEAVLARRVHLVAATVATLPIIAVTLVDTFRHATPGASWQGTETTAMTALVAPFWSIFVSYRAVLSSFPVRRSRARLWFLILPALLYAGVWTAVFLVGFGALG